MVGSVQHLSRGQRHTQKNNIADQVRVPLRIQQVICHADVSERPLQRALKRLFYHIGRWVYLLDAALDALGELEFSCIWSACLSTLDLPSDAHSALDDLGRSLGRYSAAEQHTAIDRCIAALERCSRAERETGRGNAKLKLGLSLTAGLLLAVILY